jgi:poly(A) polymerase
MDDSARAVATQILTRLRSGGFEAYFAGGCVRDLLMNQSPKDYDIATNAAPNQVRALFKNTQAVGAAFGVILVREGKTVVEVATFRTDMEYQDGRHPTGVQFSTAEEDAKRRDFTINGLFLDPIDNRIIDHVGGQADLNARVLRAIGNADQRFAEDHLRMLRAIRFASRFNFEIEPTTATAIQSHASEIIRISPERIAEELRKMLTPPTRDRAYRLLWQFGFVKILMRFLPCKVLQPSNTSIELFLALNPGNSITFGLALAALVLEVRINANPHGHQVWQDQSEAKRAAQAMRQALKISNQETDEMVWSMSCVQLLHSTPPTVAQLKRFLNQPYSADATLLLNALARRGLMSDKIRPVLASLDQLRTTDYAPAPLITGDDLTAAGASPGPRFKLALDAAYDAQLENRIVSKDEAMQLALAVLKK